MGAWVLHPVTPRTPSGGQLKVNSGLFVAWLYVMCARVMRISTSPRREASLFYLPVTQVVTGFFWPGPYFAPAVSRVVAAVERRGLTSDPHADE